MVAVSGNTVPAPVISSKVIRNHASSGSAWSEKGPQIQGTAPNQMQTDGSEKAL